LAAGAHGYLLKPVVRASCWKRVRDVYGGGSPITSSIGAQDRAPLSDSLRQHLFLKTLHVTTRPHSGPREREILDLLTRGLAYKEIADTLEISRNTVMTLVQRIYQKLHMSTRAARRSPSFWVVTHLAASPPKPMMWR
jgi:DNA-binding NarL/FixJ family response regulator